MAVVRWEPFRELAALQGEMSRWMSQMTGTTPGNGQTSAWLPAVDVWETEGELVLAFELPGVDREQVAIEVDDDVLTVSGEREKTKEFSNERFYRFERRYGSFQRSVTLPSGVDQDKIKADFADGVLEVRISKPEAVKPKKISIGDSDQATIEGDSTLAA